MKTDIVRQPLIPAFLTLLCLVVIAIYASLTQKAVSVEGIASATGPVEAWLRGLQSSYPVWSIIASGFFVLLAGTLTGQLTTRNNLYATNTCLSIPLYGIVACQIFLSGEFLPASLASLMLILAIKNYSRTFSNNIGFGEIFRGSLYLGLTPLFYAPCLALILIIPVVVVLSKPSFRKLIIATAGLILPVLTTCYVLWAIGGEFTGQLVALKESILHLQPFKQLIEAPIYEIAWLIFVSVLNLIALLLFFTNMYAAGSKPFSIIMLAIMALLLCVVIATLYNTGIGMLAIVAVPSAMLMPLFFVRIQAKIASPVYLILLLLTILLLIIQYFI